MRAIGYLGHRPDADTPSTDYLARQNEEFLEFCLQHGYQIVAAFLDADPGLPRHGLAQLLRLLDEQAPGFTVVAAPSFQHLGDDPTQAARAVLQLRARGAQVVSLAEGPLDERRLINLWRESHAPEHGLAVREAMQKHAAQGKALGRPPYGYEVGPDGRFRPIPAEAQTVQRMFRLYLDDNFGIRRIAQRLNEDGARTRRGGAWSMISIRDILRNPVYTGEYRRFDHTVADNHEAIIDPNDFATVQQRMQQRRTAPDYEIAAQPEPSDFLLSALVWCGESGTRMIGVTRRQRLRKAAGGAIASGLPNGADAEPEIAVYRYYQSEARTNQSMGGYHTRRADDLEEQVLAAVRGEGGGVKPILHIGADPDAVAAETVVALANAEGRLRRLDRRLAHLLDEAQPDHDALAHVRDETDQIVHDYESAQAELERIRARAALQEADAEHRRRQARRLQRVRDDWPALDFPTRRELIRQLVERVIVYDDRVHTTLRA